MQNIFQNISVKVIHIKKLKIMADGMEGLMMQVVNELRGKMGHSSPKELEVWKSNTNDWGRIYNRLLCYGLIAAREVNDNNLTLTQRGWEFESFEKEREDKQREKDLIQVSFDTNKSIQLLNEKTVEFYEKQNTFFNKQNGFNRTITILTWAIAISSLLYTIATWLPYFMTRTH